MGHLIAFAWIRIFKILFKSVKIKFLNNNQLYFYNLLKLASIRLKIRNRLRWDHLVILVKLKIIHFHFEKVCIS